MLISPNDNAWRRGPRPARQDKRGRRDRGRGNSRPSKAREWTADISSKASYMEAVGHQPAAHFGDLAD